MKLKAAINELRSMCENDIINEIVLQKEDDYMMVANDTFIYIPSLKAAIFDMTYLVKDEYSGDFETDWCGTAIYVDGELAMYESDNMETTIHNYFASHCNINIKAINDAYVSNECDAVINAFDEVNCEDTYDYSFAY